MPKPENAAITRSEMRLALRMARISRFAYVHSKHNKAPACATILRALKRRDNRYVSVQGVSRASDQAIFVVHRDFACIAFRGTDEWRDWLDNLDAGHIGTVGRDYAQFHRGFYQACEKLWPFMRSAVTRHSAGAGADVPLYLTGHSLGGALATVAAARLEEQGIGVSGVFTFGQPRVMRRKAAKAFHRNVKARFFRFQNNQDIVPRLPSRFMRFRHVGQCLHIDATKNIHASPQLLWRLFDFCAGAADAMVGRLMPKRRGAGMLRDHHIDQYIASLSRQTRTEDAS